MLPAQGLPFNARTIADVVESPVERDAARVAVRQERSVPILDEIKAWLDRESEIVLPRSPMSKATAYAQNQWAALCVYTTDGKRAIDNNAAERALERVAIRRKSWLFAGNDEAAANHAKIWSLIASCEHHGVDPQRYLTSVLAKLPFIREGDPKELEQFLPDVWKREDAAEAVPQVEEANRSAVTRSSSSGM